jgi:TonB family protein
MRAVIATLALATFAPISAASQKQPSSLARAAAERETILAKKIAADPTDFRAYLELARFQEEFGAFAAAEATLLKARQVIAKNKDVALWLLDFYYRRRQFEKALEVLRILAGLDPADLSIQLNIANYFEEKAKEDRTAKRGTYIREGLAATDRVLTIEPDNEAAMAHKVGLLWMSAELITDPAEKKKVLEEAGALLFRAMSRSRETEAPSIAGLAPVRVGGDIKPPVRIKNVPPVYPEEAAAAGTQGAVVIEATINAAGGVSGTRLLHSIPQFDQAALDAVRQWIYEPTTVDGRPVPVIMTITVNFTLQ